MSNKITTSDVDGLPLLLIEDDAETAAGVAVALAPAGWRVRVARDGPDGLRQAFDGSFAVIVADRMLPGLDGLAVVSALRAACLSTPVLMLTALSAVDERVRGLEAGADDYLVKPYASSELRARVHALARRAPVAAENAVTLRVGDLTLHRLERRTQRGTRSVDLLPLEFKLLEVLALNFGRVVTRAMLLEQVWRFQFDPQTNIVETHISRLRRKLDGPGEAPLIVTVRGAGYVLSDSPA